jgi:hypothetical protein
MNAPADTLQAWRVEHSRSSVELSHHLPDVADRLHSQIHELVREPTPERAERLCVELEGTKRFILRIREALVREAREPNA